MKNNYSRREFLKRSSLAGLGGAFTIGATMPTLANNYTSINKPTSLVGCEPIIDIHQHTHYHSRTDAELVTHQRAHERGMGVINTILLPSGSYVSTAATNYGDANGLAVGAGGNEFCYKMAQKYPEEFLFGANEVPDLPDAVGEIEKYLQQGAQVIGELKFGIACDAPEMQAIYELAQSYNVPVLMHWLHGSYNYGFDRFYKMLKKYPKVNFIGHAQTWWANIDKNYNDPTIHYPKGPVTKGGLTDRYLSDYPNIYGDLSAGSGLNALTRDEDFTTGFLERHQDQLLYGSDCHDTLGHGSACIGVQTIKTIRKLSPSKKIERKLLFENAKKLYEL